MQFQRGAERLFGKLRRQVASRGWLAIAVLVLAQVTVTGPARGEDGYELWLRYQPLAPAARERLADAVTGIYAGNRASPVLQAATGELERGLSRLSGRAVALLDAPGPGAVVVGQPDGSGLAEALSPMLARVGPAVRAWWRDRAVASTFERPICYIRRAASTLKRAAASNRHHHAIPARIGAAVPARARQPQGVHSGKRIVER